MSDRPVISVENLGKTYRISHQGGRSRYLSLRDVIADQIGGWFRRRDAAENRSFTEDFWALREVSFEVGRGEVVGIIGRNGAGKSTLLKILSRITEPSEGRVRIKGRVASLLEVGTGFHPELTGRENIYLNGAILGMSRAEIRLKFDEIVAFAEVEQFLDTPVKRYSSGMYVRLAFAVAAHLEPEILIVDEVLAVGDAQFQKKCLGKMESVAEREGRTVIFVSHNIAAVRQLCRRVMVLDHGKISFQGPTEAGLDRYLEDCGEMENRPRSFLELPPHRHLPLYLKRASLSSDTGNDGQLFMNQPLTVKFEFASQRPTREVIVGLVIYDAKGQALLNINNIYQPYTPLPEPVTSGQVICELGNVPWMPGRYTISLWIGLTESELQFIERGLTFTVLPRDAWGTGRLPPENSSTFWWPTRFKLLPAGPN